jgi:hypothetical protein
MFAIGGELRVRLDSIPLFLPLELFLEVGWENPNEGLGLSRRASKANAIVPTRVYRSAVNGYATRISDTQYRRLLASTAVTAVAPDEVVATAPPFTILPPPAEQPAQAQGMRSAGSESVPALPRRWTASMTSSALEHEDLARSGRLAGGISDSAWSANTATTRRSRRKR